MFIYLVSIFFIISGILSVCISHVTSASVDKFQLSTSPT